VVMKSGPGPATSPSGRLAASAATTTPDVATKRISTDSAFLAHGLGVYKISTARAYYCVRNGPEAHLSLMSPSDRAAGPGAYLQTIDRASLATDSIPRHS
jgi:hypothetical protein